MSKPKIEIVEINRLTVAVMVNGEEKARFSGKTRDEQAEAFEKQVREQMKPKGGLWDLKGSEKIISEHPRLGKSVEIVSVGSTESCIRLKGYSSANYWRKNGLERGGDGRIYINDAEVAQIEAAANQKRIDDNARFAAERAQRDAERAADPRTPLLDKFEMSPPAFYKMTLEQLKQIETWSNQ